jgi:hypothetical protein
LKISEQNPALIALDVDLRSPLLDGRDHQVYQEENRQLFKAIQAVAQKDIDVVLAVTIDEKEQGYVLEPTVLDSPLDKATEEWWRKKIRIGYINLPKDKREIPLHQALQDGRHVDSFAEAIVRVVNEKVLDLLGSSDELPYGGFIGPERFATAGLVSHANEVMEKKEHVPKLAHKAVIIGGAWSRFAYGRGEKVDTHFTPAGKMVGVYIHANYVEAISSGQTYKRLWGEKTNGIVEVLLAIGLILLHAQGTSPEKVMMIVIFECGLLFTIGFFLLHNVGIVFDFFILAVMAIIHVIIHR